MNARFKSMRLLVWSLVLLTWTSLLSAAELIAFPLSPEMAARVDLAVQTEMKKEQVVGLAVGILQQGRIVYLKGYGFADREQNLPVTTETMFRWASCSKPLTAVAALQLVEKGRLDLDADVRKYVPEFPDKGAVITVRELLCHQSGIIHYGNTPTERKYDTPHPFADPVTALDMFKESPLLFKPGEKCAYSSYGYMLLSAVVERAGRQKFAGQVEERIAKPLGMTTLQPDYQWVSISNRAVGYLLADGQVVRSTDTDQSWKWGAGNYISTIGDFAKFAEGLLQGALVNKETQTRMWEPQKTRDGMLETIVDSGTTTQYGLGFEVQVNRKGELVKAGHGGGQEKARTRLVIYPGLHHGVVVMTNCEWVNPGIFSTLIYAALGKD